MKRTALKRGTKRLAKKKKKRSQREILRDRAWIVFSKWIRTRDPYCVTHLILGEKKSSENAGHYWHGKLDFDEVNINGQCVNCNLWNSGRLAEYTTYLIDKYGIEEFEALKQRKNIATKGEYRTEQDYLDIIEKYKIK